MTTIEPIESSIPKRDRKTPPREQLSWASPPIAARRLIGRSDLLQTLREHLDEGILIVSGTGGSGVGATALARRLAASSAGNYPDGCIELNLRGDETATLVQRYPEACQLRVVRTLEPKIDIPDDPKALRKLYLATLARHRVLLILDDATSAVQLRALLPRSSDGIIVTSQTDLSATYPRFHYVRLEGLQPEPARRLLVQSAPDLMNLPRRQLVRVAARAGNLPLALRVIAPLLTPTGQLSPRQLVRALTKAEKRIIALQGKRTPDTVIDIALETAYEHLAPELKPQFEALSVFQAPFTADAAAAVWGIENSAAKEHLSLLTNSALVDALDGTDHYDMHHRVRQFAQELFLSQPERSVQAVANYVAHYLREAVQLSALLSLATPKRRSNSLDPYLAWQHLPTAWCRLNGQDSGWPQPTSIEKWISNFPRHAQPLLEVTLSRKDYRAWISQALVVAEATEDTRAIAWLQSTLGQTKPQSNA